MMAKLTLSEMWRIYQEACREHGSKTWETWKLPYKQQTRWIQAVVKKMVQLLNERKP